MPAGLLTSYKCSDYCFLIVTVPRKTGTDEHPSYDAAEKEKAFRNYRLEESSWYLKPEYGSVFAAV